MKKAWVAIINVFIMIAMLAFVVLYSSFESRNTEQRQIGYCLLLFCYWLIYLSIFAMEKQARKM